VGAGWLVQAEHESRPADVLLVCTRTAGRTVDDLAAPPTARILRHDLVDSALLEQLEARGLIRAVPTGR
jgi:hypothetical protein